MVYLCMRGHMSFIGETGETSFLKLMQHANLFAGELHETFC